MDIDVYGPGVDHQAKEKCISQAKDRWIVGTLDIQKERFLWAIYHYILIQRHVWCEEIQPAYLVNMRSVTKLL